MGSPALEPQRVLAGRYRLERQLGAGGMGAIWLAEHLMLQAPVAVKLIDRDAVPDEQTIARFLREAKAAATLRSPHVVQILDYGMDAGVPFIVMELLEGETLAQRLRRAGPLSAAEAARIVSHIGRAVARAHEAGIIHRDLKPENVFLVHNEDEEIAKVLDFGVAKIEPGKLGTEGTETRTGSILGTPYYMSPEQAQGNKAVDYRSDLWSIGVIAFECLTCKRPFHSEGLGDLVLQICVRDMPVPSEVAAVPIGFDAWFARALARDPEERFQSAREMTDALREALGVEMREAPGTQPEILFSSAEEPARPAADIGAEKTTRSDEIPLNEAPTRVMSEEQARRVRRESARPGLPERRLSRESTDPTAATLQADHVESSLAPSRRNLDLPATEAAEGKGLALVVAVAALALGLGLGGGIWFLQKSGVTAAERASGSEVSGRAPNPPVKRAESLLAADQTAEQAAAPPPSSASASVAASAAPAAAPPSASAPARDEAPASIPTPTPSPMSERWSSEPILDAGAPENRAADGGWVKPEWAIPDEEPRSADEIVGDDPYR
jgi:serine/threonine-protein kinase